jgi:hypothetical protein
MRARGLAARACKPDALDALAARAFLPGIQSAVR